MKSLGGKPIIQSIEDSSIDDMVKTIKSTNPSTVIWAAGAGAGNAERTKAVDNEGAIRSMDATAKAGVKRYIIISAVDVRDRENKPKPEWYNDEDLDRSNKVWKAIGVCFDLFFFPSYPNPNPTDICLQPYMEAKYAADRSLVTENGRRGLEYTIVRPGGLSEDPAKGTVSAGKVHINTTISREDVASVVVEALKQDGTKGLAIDVVGGSTPIKDAIAEVVKGKVDTFAGRY